MADSPDVVIHGIPNCDTVRRARAWLVARDVPHRFHDFRRDGLPATLLATWVEHLGTESLLNRRGTTWRGLSEQDRACDPVALMLAQPALVKRPVLAVGDALLVGFDEAAWTHALETRS